MLVNCHLGNKQHLVASQANSRKDTPHVAFASNLTLANMHDCYLAVLILDLETRIRHISSGVIQRKANMRVQLRQPTWAWHMGVTVCETESMAWFYECSMQPNKHFDSSIHVANERCHCSSVHAFKVLLSQLQPLSCFSCRHRNEFGLSGISMATSISCNSSNNSCACKLSTGEGYTLHSTQIGRAIHRSVIGVASHT